MPTNPKPAHTPGPWSIAPTFAEHGLTMNDGSIPLMAGDIRVCLVDYQGEQSIRKRYKAESVERDANARLIAAAPALLEALEAIVASLTTQDDEGLIEHAEPMARARATLKLAWGGE